MKTRLTSRLSVPPNPAAIFEGSSSLRFGSLAPRPTLIPERPKQRIATIPMCSTIIAGPIRSIRSLRTTRISVATSEIPEENANLPQRIDSRFSGRRPRTQKFRPSSESSGKMNRLVNVERIRAVTERLRKLIRFRQYGFWTS